jgi:Predicted metal binding domain
VHEAAAKALFDKQAGFAPPLLAERKWELLSNIFPVLDVVFTSVGRVPLRVRFHCPDWNDIPPSIALLDRDGNYLVSIPRDPAGVFNPSMHPGTGRPFICMRGALEYHIHPSHVNDPWDQLKGKSSYDLGGILTQVWRAWKKANP